MGKVIIKACGYCKGSGEAQSLERFSDGEWVKENAMPHAMADAKIAREGSRASVRWVDVACPMCQGKKTVEVELTPCRIF